MFPFPSRKENRGGGGSVRWKDLAVIQKQNMDMATRGGIKHDVLTYNSLKQSPRSGLMLTPYYALMWGTFGGMYHSLRVPEKTVSLADRIKTASMYAMGRQVCGYKTWFGKN